jgi:hypothetical protein
MINFSHKIKERNADMGGAFLRELKLDFVRYKKKPSDVQMNFFTLFNIVESIIISITLRMYFSKAIVIEGAFGDGAKISILNHCPKLLCVVLPKRLFWFLFLNPEVLNNDLIPVGLKKASIS